MVKKIKFVSLTDPQQFREKTIKLLKFLSVYLNVLKIVQRKSVNEMRNRVLFRLSIFLRR